MLMLLFQLDNSRYAIPASEVVEVAPRVRLAPLAKAPAYIAGLLNYRDRQVPVIDLCQLLNNRSCRNCLTTRIILVRYPAAGDSHILGLLAEAVTETYRFEAGAFHGTGVRIDEAPYLSEAAQTNQGLVQKLTVASLLPAHVQSQLFPPRVG
jgi:chemotaxis-related protein WspB